MNYIRHLNAFFSHVKTDNRLTSSHVSLYMALFQYWNFNRFQNPFPVYRDDIMKLCKIGSKNTYHKCIKELHHCKYIIHHPAISKYQPVKISMIRLDKQVPKNPEQLNLFSPKSGTHTSIKNDTQYVPILTATSPNIDTTQVPNMGHLIKPNNKQERETSPTHQIFKKKNNKIQEATNEMAQVPKSVHTKGHSGLDPESFPQPTINQVEDFFSRNNYPSTEAKKFFNHYKALGWKIQGKTPIQDWKPLVEKWMTNAKKWDSPSPSLRGAGADRSAESATKQTGEVPKDLQYLYDSFLEGKRIFHQITVSHLDQLKLKLTEETLQQARHERINEVSGTNQHSLNQIWQAYLTNDPNNQLVQKDKPNLIALAKRIQVFKHFQQLKNKNIKELPLPP